MCVTQNVATDVDGVQVTDWRVVVAICAESGAFDEAWETDSDASALVDTVDVDGLDARVSKAQGSKSAGRTYPKNEMRIRTRKGCEENREGLHSEDVLFKISTQTPRHSLANLPSTGSLA